MNPQRSTAPATEPLEDRIATAVVATPESATSILKMPSNDAVADSMTLSDANTDGFADINGIHLSGAHLSQIKRSCSRIPAWRATA